MDLFNSNTLLHKIINKILPVDSKRRKYAKNVWWKLNPGSSNKFNKPYVPKLKLPVIKEGEVESQKDIIVSVVIPTKNAGSNFKPLLSILKGQKGFKKVEIIVVDSGSSDETIKIAKVCGAKIIEIPPEKFSHSYSRNIGAKSASGKYIFFTVQDALPPSALFLYKLLSVLKNNDVVAVSCTETPREDADLFYNVEIWGRSKFLEVDKNDRILSLPEIETHINLLKNGQLTNFACLISKDIFMKYKFESNFAEDLVLGIRLIKDGHKLALLNSINIIHSHNRLPYYFLKRNYVGYTSLVKYFPNFSVPVINEQQLFREIFQIYYSLYSLINEVLPRTKAPLGVEELFKIVKNNLSTSACTENATYFEPTGFPQMDDNLKYFLKKLYGNYQVDVVHNSNNRPLLNDVLRHLNMVREYMATSFPLVDEGILEDFKSCIPKVYASHCGVHLAYCYLNGSSVVRDLHKQLMKDV